VPVPGYKLVPKRATRSWANEGIAKATLLGMGVQSSALVETKMKSPAQVEKLLPRGEKLPADLVQAISSGNTIAPESDPRPAVMTVGKSLAAALGKL
jgi:hypothetical protein